MTLSDVVRPPMWSLPYFSQVPRSSFPFDSVDIKHRNGCKKKREREMVKVDDDNLLSNSYYFPLAANDPFRWSIELTQFDRLTVWRVLLITPQTVRNRAPSQSTFSWSLLGFRSCFVSRCLRPWWHSKHRRWLYNGRKEGPCSTWTAE